jgi:hypothetical protein
MGCQQAAISNSFLSTEDRLAAIFTMFSSVEDLWPTKSIIIFFYSRPVVDNVFNDFLVPKTCTGRYLYNSLVPKTCSGQGVSYASSSEELW